MADSVGPDDELLAALSTRGRRALEAYAGLQRAAALTAQAVERVLAEHDLTGSQVGVLDVLAQRGPLHQQELAETLARSKAQMTAILDALEKRGLVRRERRADDRRFIRVELLPAGIALLARAHPARVAAVRDALRGLDGKARRKLSKLTRRLARALRPDEATEPGVVADVPAEAAPIVEASPVPAATTPPPAPERAVLAPDDSAAVPSAAATPEPASPVTDPADLGFIHRFRPAASPIAPRVLLLLLHGTGGNEDDLLQVADLVAPGSAVLSPRGRSLDEGAPRFFRRLREGVFDQADLEVRTHELAAFVWKARTTYDIAELPIIAVGFSNGANIASSLLLRHPGLLRGALLLRGMLPFTPTTPPALAGTTITLVNGLYDPIVPRDQPETLATHFREAGADVRLEWLPTGHQLTSTDMQLGRDLVRTVVG